MTTPLTDEELEDALDDLAESEHHAKRNGAERPETVAMRARKQVPLANAIAERGRRDGWGERVVQSIALHSGSATEARRAFTEAREIRGLVRLAARSLEGAGYRVDGFAEEVVLARVPLAQFRAEMIDRLAEADEERSIDTARKINEADRVVSAAGADVWTAIAQAAYAQRNEVRKTK